MRDLDLDYWRKSLQEARALHKKIEKLPAGKEKEELIKKHKKLLDEARKRLHEKDDELINENIKEGDEK